MKKMIAVVAGAVVCAAGLFGLFSYEWLEHYGAGTQFGAFIDGVPAVIPFAMFLLGGYIYLFTPIADNEIS